MKSSKMQKVIVSKGYEKEERTKHDFYFHYFPDGLPSGRYTFFSRGTSERELSTNRQNEIAKQMGLQLREFRDFMACTMTLEGYNAVLRSKEKDNAPS